MTPLSIDDVEFVGAGLRRPECVLANAGGDLFAADWRGGVAHFRPDGSSVIYVGTSDDVGGSLLPNGVALDRDGSFLVTHLGPEAGGLFRLTRDGQVRPVLREVGGEALPPTNFVLLDRQGRLWITVSTRKRPRDRGYRAGCDDGFIVCLDARGARVVADGLAFANEVQVDARGEFLYVNETFGRRMSRFRIAAEGTLTNRETVAEFGPGTFPDGLALDAEGSLWATSIVSNRLIRVDPSGRQTLILEDSDPDHLAWVESAYRAGALGRVHLDTIKSRKLRSISSLAFGGGDLRVGYLGCLLGDRIARVRIPVAGAPPVHWLW
ncbi:MAG TPA: SMP-30/gluconolactonase/LRE family protein [Alphaproteobacteria bacterium]|nr:SMP-30/gluconolactonase/LRE family protein [Alphaproteobacteria bacterium]